MPWGVVAGAAIGAIGSGLSASTQASAAEQAAQMQQQAAYAQLGLNSSVFNAQGALSLPTRESGGLAQSREDYLLGLTPNLDISSDFSTPNIQVNPTTGQTTSSWNGPAQYDPSVTGSNPSATAYGGYGSYTPGLTMGSNGQPVVAQPSLSAMYGSPTTVTPTGSAVGPLSTGINAIAASQNGGAPLTATGSMGMPATGTGAAATASNGVPNPNAALPASSYGSFASPYNPSTFYQDPGYNFILQQNEQQIQNQAATSGLALSPSSLSAALSYSSGLASQEFNNAYNRSMNTQTTQLNELNALTSGGQIATSGLSTAAGNFGAAGSSALAGYGNAGAAGAIGTGNAYASGINGATNSALYGNYAYNTGFGSGETPYASYQANSMLPQTNSMIAGDPQMQALNTPS
jgi:hypothetical protein